MPKKSDTYDKLTRTPVDEAAKIAGSRLAVATYARTYRTFYDWVEFGVPAKIMELIRRDSEASAKPTAGPQREGRPMERIFKITEPLSREQERRLVELLLAFIAVWIEQERKNVHAGHDE